MPNPTRIAIVGGGPAGLSAAYHLSEADPNLEITVYQLGWRLGGKGATGRDESNHFRIEEHGIHGFCKFYFHTWELMKKVYAEVGHGAEPCLPVQSLPDAFLPSSTSYSTENVDGCWTREVGGMPSGDGLPWDDEPLDVSKAAIVLGLLGQLLRRGRPGDPRDLGFDDLLERDALPRMTEAARELHQTFRRAYLSVEQQIPDFGDDETGVRSLASSMQNVDTQLRAKRGEFDTLRKQIRRDEHVQVHRALSSVDMGLALFVGLVKAGFWGPGFDLDDFDPVDYREWLSDNGASDHTLASASVMSVANILFAYPEGDSTREPELSAASWLNWVLRSVVGKGAYFYFLAAGTGDTVILPLYKALLAHGVKFEFFHKLKGVKTTGGPGTRVLEELVFERQASTAGAGDYDPLITMAAPEGVVQPWCVWPNQPLWDQLTEGDLNKSNNVDFEEWSDDKPSGSQDRVLARGTDADFDYVVWALPSSMIPHVGDQKMQEEWDSTVTHLPPTATQAIQLWLTHDTKDLGWPRSGLPTTTDRYGGAGFPNPLNGGVAFDDLLQFERWPDDGPKGLLYLCSQLHDWPGVQSRFDDEIRVRQSASASLRQFGNFLVDARPPLADQSDSQAIDFGYLYDPDPLHQGEQRLLYQYARANTRPTEAYIRAPKDSVLGRRDAWKSGFKNVAVAGDWMYNGFNLGSFESAVTGGKLAAFALTGVIPVDDLAGLNFLHPRARERATQALANAIVPMIT